MTSTTDRQAARVRADVVTSSIGDVPQWRLMARRFKRSRLAIAGGVILLLMYAAAAFAPFFSPNAYDAAHSSSQNAPPSKLTWHGGPAICGVAQKLNKQTFEFQYATDCGKPVSIQWFGHGYEYKLLGLFTTDRHLMTVDGPAKLFLWGADTQGRDLMARVLQGARVSLTIGLLGVGVAVALGTLIGAVSGYFGGPVDTAIQRLIEIMNSVPTLPLWAGLAAILPRDLSVTARYLLITVILAGIAWGGLARQVRAKVMAFSSTDYVLAARAAGSSHGRIIVTHMIPNAISHVIVVAMFAIPGAILAETALSFLGIGMLPPAVSWGVLLSDAQRVDVVTRFPWLLIPAGFVILTVTCYQLLGDGLRDAVDPYS